MTGPVRRGYGAENSFTLAFLNNFRHNKGVTITILGTGYVGLTTAVLFAHANHTVYAVEPNKERLNTIKSGRSFFYEEGIDELVASALRTGRFFPTDSYDDSVSSSDIVISCVGTPDNPDGSSNLSYVFNAARDAIERLKDGAIFVQKSTVPVGTGQKLKKIIETAGKNIAYVSNPEFLSESTAIADSLFYDRLVVGGDDEKAMNTVLAAYKTIEARREEIANIAGITPQNKPMRHITTTLNSAELIKVTANSILALKISYANSIAKLADKAGADIIEVMDAVGADDRIGRHFLNAGRGYGGGCFPKDVSGLIASGLEYGVDLEIMQAAQSVNESMAGYVVEKMKEALGGDLTGKKIAVLGLAFKANTSDTRRSPGVKIANIIAKAGAQAYAYDPVAMEEAKSDLHRNITPSTSLEEAITGADATLIATNWPEFLHYPAAEYARHMAGTLFFDAVNGYNKGQIQTANLQYIGVGRNGVVNT